MFDILCIVGLAGALLMAVFNAIMVLRNGSVKLPLIGFVVFMLVFAAGLVVPMFAPNLFGGGDSEPPVLLGEWRQTDTEENEDFVAAYISEDTVETYLLSGDDTRELFWSGTFVPPEDGKTSYKWISERHDEKLTDTPLAPEEETLEFRYKKGTLTVPFNGKKIKLAQEPWGYSEPVR